MLLTGIIANSDEYLITIFTPFPLVDFGGFLICLLEGCLCLIQVKKILLQFVGGVEPFLTGLRLLSSLQN